MTTVSSIIGKALQAAGVPSFIRVELRTEFNDVRVIMQHDSKECGMTADAEQLDNIISLLVMARKQLK